MINSPAGFNLHCNLGQNASDVDMAMSALTMNKSLRPSASLIAGPTIFSLFLILQPSETEAVNQALGLTAWMAIWWMTEAVPLATTSFLPLLIWPVLGLLDAKVVASRYFTSTSFLFLGGFLLVLSECRHPLHWFSN